MEATVDMELIITIIIVIAIIGMFISDGWAAWVFQIGCLIVVISWIGVLIFLIYYFIRDILSLY